MNKIVVAAACLTLAASPSAATHQGYPSNSLPRALAAFTAADIDRDGKISSEEARTIPISPEEFVKADGEGDGAWSRDEFMLFYHRRLVSDGQPVGPDLEAEVARIQALKRVRVVEQVRKESGVFPGPSAGIESVGARLERALGDLERNAAAKKATPDDFRRLRNLVILSGRSISEPLGHSRSPTAQAKMLQTLDRIEERAATGQYVRDDFEKLRGFATPSTAASEIAKSGPREPTPGPTSGSKPVSTPTRTSLIPDRTGPVQGPADARRRVTDPRGSNRGGQQIDPPRQKPETAPTPAPVERPVVPPNGISDPDRSRP